MLFRTAAFVAALMVGAAGCASNDADSDTDTGAPQSSTGAPQNDAQSTTETTVAANQLPMVELGFIQGRVLADPRVNVNVNETVRFTFTSDVDEEAHIHGYDHTIELKANEPTPFEFTADIAGVFEVELHGAHKLLTQLVVTG